MRTDHIHFNSKIYATSLEALLSLQNSEFICCCYQTLLNRDVSPTELDKYLDLLDQGTTPMEIIVELLESFEGQNIAADLPGLLFEIKRYKKSRIPVIGWMLRCFYRIAPSRRNTRNENQIIRLSPWGQELLRRIDAESEKHRASKDGHQCV